MSPASGTYEITINGGRIMDPLTRTDGIANLGINNGKVVAIAPVSQRLEGDTDIDASGLVVAPGFINIHGHGSGTGVGAEFHVRDGITTEVTGNCGISGEGEIADESMYPLKSWFAELEKGGLIINVASYVGHNTLRRVAAVPDVYTPATTRQVGEMIGMVREEMAGGAMGVSFGPFYGPGSTYDEMVTLAREVSVLGGCAACHVRTALPPADLDAVIEGINVAREARLPFIISHLGGPTYGHTHSGAALELIQEGREDGLKLATDCHTYDAFHTAMGAPAFDAPIEGFKVVNAEISDFRTAREIVIQGNVFMKAGERFSSAEQWNLVRGKVKAGEIPDPTVIGHLYKSYKVFLWLSYPFTMVENDGALKLDPTTGRISGHPRGAGAFARFLGYWVRERQVCDLMTALRKTSTLAALWLGLERKGRVQVGCDADITLFDPNSVMDRATYLEPGIPSEGIPFVIVNGVVVVDRGKLTGRRAGSVIRRTWKVPGF